MPAGRPAAVYKEEDGQLRACLAPAVNLRTTPLDLASARGMPLLRVRVLSARTRRGRLSAVVDASVAGRAGGVDVPVALERCGPQATVVDLRTLHRTLSRGHARFMVQSRQFVSGCPDGRMWVSFRAQSPSVYVVSKPAAAA